MSLPLRHRTLSAAICDDLRQAILDGRQPSGTQLRQEALARSYGVSRIPLREALFQLEAEGLVRIVPHKGAVVAGLSAEEVADICELRALLEPRLLRSSAPLLDDSDFRRVDRIHADFIAAVTAGDVARWGELNAALHMALYAKASQPRSTAIVAGLLQTSDRYTRVQLSTPVAMKRAEREHGELIALCRKSRIDEACALLVSHIEGVRADLIGLIDGPDSHV